MEAEQNSSWDEAMANMALPNVEADIDDGWDGPMANMRIEPAASPNTM